MSSSSQNHDHLHLTEIFHLYPEEEPFCVGHASSSGHRCRQPTNAKNRHTACTLLEKGTAMLRKGQGVDKLLRDLAPLVLCNRWHQDQADHFINVWTGQVSTYIGKKGSTRATESPQPIEPRQSTFLGEYWDTVPYTFRGFESTFDVLGTESKDQRRGSEKIKNNTENLVGAAVGAFTGVQEKATNPSSAMTSSRQPNEQRGGVRSTQSGSSVPSTRIGQNGCEQNTLTRLNSATSQRTRDANTSSSNTRVRTGNAAAPSQVVRHMTPSSNSRLTASSGTTDFPRVAQTFTIPSHTQNQSSRATETTIIPSAINLRNTGIPANRVNSGGNTGTATRTNNADLPSGSTSARKTIYPRSTSIPSLLNTGNIPAANITSTPNPPRASRIPRTTNAANSSRVVKNAATASLIGTSMPRTSGTTAIISRAPSPIITEASSSSNPSEADTPASPFETLQTNTNFYNLLTSGSTHPNVSFFLETSSGELFSDTSSDTQSSTQSPQPRTDGTRQPVEGECSICLALLRDESSGDTYKDRLAWCKIRCGANFHRSCIDKWINSSKKHETCPMCRAKWKFI